MKERMIRDIKVLLDYVVVVIIAFTFYEVYFSSDVRNFFGVSNFNRGIGNFYLVSIFGSGPSLASFMSLYVIYWFYYHKVLSHKNNVRQSVLLYLSVIICLLSFSRKEVLLLSSFFVFFPYSIKSKLQRTLKIIVAAVVVCAGLFIYYQEFFQEANEVAMTDDYVRWQILQYSVDVFDKYAPFGSGPGTFGSQMSLQQTHVYNEFNIGRRILGDGLANRGPIYDVFLFTFIAEIGIGFLLYGAFFLKLARSVILKEGRAKRFIVRFLVFYLFIMSMFTPVLMNSFGFLLASTLGVFVTIIGTKRFSSEYA
ncbi:hypothetical protein [Anseongella ginsenosidimutans]|uniref:hypothetical protein n=1 Tax=Anseongella ginsenosidimutans TaxID=496056 RepID=UPI001CEF7D32|nr:hypothetical protein [Anseongella ginsenosidimutans]